MEFRPLSGDFPLFPNAMKFAHLFPFFTGAQMGRQGFYLFFSFTEEPGMLHLLWTAIIGIVVGALAKLIMPGKDPGGIWITMLLGIAGSFVGTWLGSLVGHYQEGDSAGFIMSLVGALVLLGAYHLIRRKSTT
jgi:uncharacterized membrane protein YeaQ/YmgE (transglycosylase-associated protein family)